jgi:hypothetical protein
MFPILSSKTNVPGREQELFLYTIKALYHAWIFCERPNGDEEELEDL